MANERTPTDSRQEFLLRAQVDIREMLAKFACDRAISVNEMTQLVAGEAAQWAKIATDCERDTGEIIARLERRLSGS